MIRRQITRWTNWMDNNKLQTIIMVPFTLIGVCAIMILAFMYGLQIPRRRWLQKRTSR